MHLIFVSANHCFCESHFNVYFFFLGNFGIACIVLRMLCDFLALDLVHFLVFNSKILWDFVSADSFLH